MAREIKRLARFQLVRFARDNQVHPTTNDMGNLFLRVFVLWHSTARLQFSLHLIHVRAAANRASPNPRRNLDPGIFHFVHRGNDAENLRVSNWQKVGPPPTLIAYLVARIQSPTKTDQ